MKEARRCFDELQPYVEDICRAVANAPISPQEKAALAFILLGRFLGLAVWQFSTTRPEFESMSFEELSQFVMANVSFAVQRDGQTIN